VPEIRLAEIIASLSLATDLGMGQPMEQALRTCLLAVRLTDALALDAVIARSAYYVALLRWVGCTADAHEFSILVGDEIAARTEGALADFGSPLEMASVFLRITGRQSMRRRVRTVTAIAAAGPRALRRSATAHCEVAQLFAARLTLGHETERALGDIFERWDGRGHPAGRRGDEIAPAARIANLARDLELLYRLGGAASAVAVARRRAGRAYDPRLVERFVAQSSEILSSLDNRSPWDAALTLEPRPWRVLTGPDLDSAAEVFADFVDIKSVYTVGHSRGVAELAAKAAEILHMPDLDVASLRRAGLLHDIGRTGVPNSVWEKRGSLTGTEWERVRLHPYLTERVLARPEPLQQEAQLAGLHHERTDGSGYHRNARGAEIPMSARILAAADAFHAMTEARPYRPARSGAEAAHELQRDAAAGRLDRDATRAVLEAAGLPPPRREVATDLSAREIEVLRHVVRGASNKVIARALGISPSTVHHHVQHIYDKIGVSSRAAATLYATSRGLVGDAITLEFEPRVFP
jgi:HD-GYP domain-containing protein (c-di-GMP phosphodiesterase class II)